MLHTGDEIGRSEKSWQRIHKQAMVQRMEQQSGLIFSMRYTIIFFSGEMARLDLGIPLECSRIYELLRSHTILDPN